jgi:hypothetical protein
MQHFFHLESFQQAYLSLNRKGKYCFLEYGKYLFLEIVGKSAILLFFIL